jgi:hypothetical protein
MRVDSPKEHAMPRQPFAAIATLVAAIGVHAQDAPQPLDNPLPAPIAKGDIVVAAVPFVRAPMTADTAKPVGTNNAHARLQYMKPIPDGSGRLVFSDLRGVLYITDEAGRQPSVYLDLRTADVGFYNTAFPNESGLLGFAFHPEFGMAGKPGFGKLYTAASSEPADGPEAPAGVRKLVTYLSGQNQESEIREWTTADPAADAFQGASRGLLRVSQFSPTHNVATIAFNPAALPGSTDFGMLYACLGDGGGANDPHENGQNPGTLLATIIRIDPLGGSSARPYGIPSDNPFAGGDGGAPEVWAYGLRHAQHFSWDSSGRMFINDIGQDMVEEVNIGVAGGNYGWRVREGTFATGYGIGAMQIGPVFARPEAEAEDFIYPVAEYDHDEGYAIGSGYAYEGDGIPALKGKYVFADITTGRVFTIDTDELTPGDPATIEELRLSFEGEERTLLDVAGFENTYHGDLRADLRLGIDSAGELYLLTKGDGWIRKLVATP